MFKRLIKKLRRKRKKPDHIGYVECEGKSDIKIEWYKI